MPNGNHSSSGETAGMRSRENRDRITKLEHEVDTINTRLNNVLNRIEDLQAAHNNNRVRIATLEAADSEEEA